MTSGTSAAVLRQFRTLYEAGTVAGMTDGQLLERFYSGRGEEAEVAFAALLARHGAMVLGVCRRALRDPNDADDAFQATFLILVRKGRSVRVEDSLGRWLYGVSRKVAARAKGQADRRRGVALAEAASLPGPGGEADLRDLRDLLDEELARLAEPFRSAVVLCDLGGLSLEEAARDLRCPVGTIKSRLTRGRERLRVRLARRGLAPTAAIFAAEASAPAALVEATVRGVARYAASGRLEAGMVPASVLSLAEGILRAMTLIKLKFAAATLLICGIAATGAGVFAQQGAGQGARRAFQRNTVRFSKPVDPSAAMELKLDEPVTFDFDQIALKQAVQALQDLTGLNIILDPAKLEGVDIDRTANVTLKGESIRLRVALDQLLMPRKLAFRVEDQVILIVRAEAQEPDGPAKPARGTNAVGEDRPAKATAGWNRKLDRLVTFSGDGKSLDFVLLWARAETNLNVVLDPNTIEDPRFRRDRKVSIKVDAVPLRQALRMMLGQLGLTYRFDEDVMLITLPERGSRSAGFGAPADPTRPGSPARESMKVSMPDYVIEPPDIIIVEVLEALQGRPITGERLVKPDGKISLGFYGEVYVAGLTTSEAKAKVLEHLRQYLPAEKLGLSRTNPDTRQVEVIPASQSASVFVDVAAYNSKVYYVQGEVGVPGRLPITGNETVLDAINFAGGLVPRAGVGGPNIRLVRPAKPGSTTGEQTLEVNLKAIVENGDSTTNYQIFPGDRLVVYRDPVAEPANVEPPTPAADQEARLREVERKIDLILKKLDVPAGR